MTSVGVPCEEDVCGRRSEGDEWKTRRKACGAGRFLRSRRARGIIQSGPPSVLRGRAVKLRYCILFFFFRVCIFEIRFFHVWYRFSVLVVFLKTKNQNAKPTVESVYGDAVMLHSSGKPTGGGAVLYMFTREKHARAAHKEAGETQSQRPTQKRFPGNGKSVGHPLIDGELHPPHSQPPSKSESIRPTAAATRIPFSRCVPNARPSEYALLSPPPLLPDCRLDSRENQKKRTNKKTHKMLPHRQRNRYV